MTVESNTAGIRTPVPAAPASQLAERRRGDWLSEPVAVDVINSLPGDADRFVACAPGRLDVMGGLAEYSGSSIVNMPIAGCVCVGVEPAMPTSKPAMPVSADRQAGSATLTITVGSSCKTANGSVKPLVVAIDKLFDPGGAPIEPAQTRQLIDPKRAGAAWCALATLLEMCRKRIIPRPQQGLSLAVGSTLTGLTGVAAESALSAATAAALIGLHNVASADNGVLTACRRVANRWLDLPIGAGDAHCALFGEADTLHEVHGSTPSLLQRICLSRGVTVIGIQQAGFASECGDMSPDAGTKYLRARVAAFMGRGLIERIVQHENTSDPGWDATLSSVSVEDYVNRFRDRIPTKLKGSEYLERFGETGDPLTRIDPAHTYKIRSRTEHHIYEHTRVAQFLDCLKRADDGSSPSNQAALCEAGELMSASHWSYGQRCGLGNVKADLLVRLVREYGTGKGVFGAKITGRGCGGVVAVLVKAGPDADKAIDAAIKAFDARTGRRARLLESGVSGARVTGVCKV